MEKNLSISKSDALRLYGGNQAALARAVGVTRQRIHKIKPDGDLPERLALRLRFVTRPDAFDRRGNLRTPTANHKTS
jgi:DNA-binding XRE family transcriptional regulator